MASTKPSRVFFLGFPRAGTATYVLEVIKDAVKAKDIVVTDWAMIQKPAGGDVKITESTKADPGAARGAGAGGLAGAVLSAALGPIAFGAVVGGAAIGAVTAALRDSGMKDRDLNSISDLMAEGREGLVVVVPIDDADRFQAFMDGTTEFHAADRKLTADIDPDNSLQDAIDRYVESRNT
ncbi:MAG TPA: hypothetical protein VFV72_08320 [Candidatus Limnocylindrales bacterium]|nr:hypothetical protein [Candidatus Limnocylindrales bacterium]